MQQQQAIKNSSSHIEVELINYPLLIKYANGKIKKPFQDFVISTDGEQRIENLATDEKGETGESKNKDQGETRSLSSKGSESFGYILKALFSSKKDKSSGFIGSSIENRALKEEKKAQNINVDARKIGDSLLSFKQSLVNNKKIILIVFVLVIMAAALVYVFNRWNILDSSGNNLENQQNGNIIQNTTQWAQNRVSEIKNIFSPIEGPVINDDPEDSAGQDPILPDQGNKSMLSINEILNEGNYSSIDLKTLGNNPDSQKELIKEDIYQYIREQSKVLDEGSFVFLTIYDEKLYKMDFKRLGNILELEFPSTLNQKIGDSLVDYHLGVYLNKQSVEAPNQLRLALFLIFEGANDDMVGALAAWEKTMVFDLTSLYFDGNEKLLTNQKEFNDSTINEKRRYVNFTSDQSVSLDYALASDGMIFVTSKDFGTDIIGAVN